MCRFVAYAGPPLALEPLLYGGDHSLHRQSWAPRELLSGSVNADGWGVAWYQEGSPRRLAEPRPLWQEEGVRGVLAGVRAPLALAALRNATPGIPVDRSGLLPMVLDRWTFVLNGFVPDFHRGHMRALRAELPDHLYARLRGASDSETLFLLAVAQAQAGADPVAALQRVRHRIRERVGEGEAQLTMVLGDGEELGVLRSSTVAVTNSLYLARDHPLAPGGTLLASERLDRDATWEELPTHAGIRLAPDRVQVEPLERV